jgi:hypothetical protein
MFLIGLVLFFWKRGQCCAAEVHREPMVYMPGLLLTAACDEDAKKMCNAGGRDQYNECSSSLSPGTSVLVCSSGCACC